jgi:hypothetical protein
MKKSLFHSFGNPQRLYAGLHPFHIREVPPTDKDEEDIVRSSEKSEVNI